MCGIAGTVRQKVNPAEVLALLRHRGPDEQRSWEDDDVQLIFARLAIQELSPAGSQPMTLDDVVMIFNGEIYNHNELRSKHGLKCSSHSDTETLLHLFRKMGIAMLGELDGMFAMAIYDKPARQLYLVRDRAGEKPLYYQVVGERIFFASELNVFRSITSPAVDDLKVANFLATGFLLSDETPYQNVNQLPAGCYAQIDTRTSGLKINHWWSIRSSLGINLQMSRSEAIEEVERLLTLSVKRRMTSSDLEVGSFLSGGIDSGLITALASKCTSRLRTFTVSFDGSYDEAPLARRVAEHLGTTHQELSISFDHLETDLEKIILNYGEPIMDDSIIPSYYVSREAKKHLTVILNGDGGDELFGGYRRYVPYAMLDPFKGSFRGLSRFALSVLPNPGDKMGAYSYGHRLLSLISKAGSDVYFSSTTDLLYDYPKSFRLPYDLSKYDDVMKSLPQGLSALKKLMSLDFEFLLHNILLKKIDIATMAHSLEGRAPFLSREILETAAALPDALKVSGATTKVLLRTLSEKYLPAEVIRQPKRGFEVPLREWVETRLKGIIFDYLSPASGVYVKTILEPKTVDGLLERRLDISDERRAKILFGLLATEIWKRNAA